jgi:hypothetical protein
MHTLMTADLARAQVTELTRLAGQSRAQRPLRESPQRRSRRPSLRLLLRRPVVTGS